jgi:hypothetical protein
MIAAWSTACELLTHQLHGWPGTPLSAALLAADFVQSPSTGIVRLLFIDRETVPLFFNFSLRAARPAQSVEQSDDTAGSWGKGPA